MTVEEYRRHTERKTELISQSKYVLKICDYDYYSTRTQQCKERMKQLQAEWKTVGFAGNREKELWKEFQGIQDYFWGRIKLMKKGMNLLSLSDYVSNLESDFEDARFLHQTGRMRHLLERIDEKQDVLMDLQDEVSQLEKELKHSPYNGINPLNGSG